MSITNKQIKSKDRVNSFGEVFTKDREVNAMLDLVKDHSFNINSTFLEPACGNGNFLVEILNRKLQTVFNSYTKLEDVELHILQSVSSIYGIDIQKDNCEEARKRMYQLIVNEYRTTYSKNLDKEVLYSIQYVLSLNIIQGNGLTGLLADTEKSILFSEWVFSDKEIIRKDYSMREMIEIGANKNVDEIGLLSQIGNQSTVNKPIKTFDKVYYKNLYKQK